MDKLVYFCVFLGIAVLVTFKDPIEQGKVFLNIVSKSERTADTVKSNHTLITSTNYTEDGFVDLTQTRTCVIKDESVRSALQRVITTECKERLTTIACLDQEDKLYPETLLGQCPVKSKYEKGEYLGCFRDSGKKRDMGKFTKNLKEFNSPQNCIEFCITAGYQYAALQFEKECWCSDSYGKYGELPEWSCSRPCPANKSETCGGAMANRVFSTGLPGREHHRPKVIFNPLEVEGLKPVRIAFVLTVYGRAVRQVKRLIQTLYRPHHYFFIHVDSRSNYMHRELSKLESVMPNVRLSPVRFPSIWAGISLLQGHFSFMKSLLDMTDWHWDYYMNLSESDYLIKPIEMLEMYLTKNMGKNLIAYAGRNKHPEYREEQPLHHTFYECDEHMWKLGVRELPRGIRFGGGSDWITLHRDFVEYIMADSDELVRGLKRTYLFTSFSTESFFHVLLANSAFCDKWVNENLHMINWKKHLGCQCQQLNVIDWCGCSPNDLKHEDVSRILDHINKTSFFARKFEAVVSNNVLNDLDQTLHRNTRGIVGYRHYWQNDYHYKDGPRKDQDLFATITDSMLRRVHRTIRSITPECRVRRTKLLETTYLFADDRFYSYLVKYRASVKGIPDKVTFEVRFNVMHYMRKNHKVSLSQRLRSLEVGANYDVKEQIFRNFARFIGPDSTLTLRHVWGNGPEATIKISWIDPAGVVAYFHVVDLDEGRHVKDFNPLLKTPLRPGEWVVKVTHKSSLVGEMKFLVMPYSVYNGTNITPEYVKKLHNGPDGHYFMGDPDLFSNAFRVTDKRTLSENAEKDGQRTGSQLRKWVDKISEEVWGSQDICVTDDVGLECPPFQLCDETKWSSMSPDPKAEIDKYFAYKSVMGYFELE